jgi:hypothetical protein
MTVVGRPTADLVLEGKIGVVIVAATNPSLGVRRIDGYANDALGHVEGLSQRESI